MDPAFSQLEAEFDRQRHLGEVTKFLELGGGKVTVSQEGEERG